MLERGFNYALCCLALAGIASVVPACGRKTPVRPPELVSPERIDSLAATNASEGIQLIWRRPIKYADGTRMNDLAGFRIERSAAGAPFSSVATVNVTDQDRIRQERRFRWVDADTQVGDTYQYRVVSFTADNYISQPSNVVSVERVIPTPSPARTPTAGVSR